jgi:glyoxylase I family protein
MSDPSPTTNGADSATLELATAQEPAATAPITGLSHVQLHVSDVAASARWYSTVLSLVPYAEDLSIGYVALRQPGAKLVVVLTERSEGRGDSAGSGGGALDHIAFAVSDGESLQAWAVHLSDSGIEHDDIVLENGHPSLQLRDPDGIAIELVAP